MADRLWTDREVSYLSSLAWDAGRHFERSRIAEATAELDAVWRPVGRKAHAARIAERIAEMEGHAQRVAERLGRPAGWAYRGGPVDWDTGAPVRHLEAVA